MLRLWHEPHRVSTVFTRAATSILLAGTVLLSSGLGPVSPASAATSRGDSSDAASRFLACINAPDEDSQCESLQFTANGHVLLFEADSVAVASGSHLLRTEFVDANLVAPEMPLDSPSDVADVRATSLSSVTYCDLWDGVRVVYEASEDAILKSTYYLDSGSRVDDIRLRFNRPASLDQNGNLVVVFDTGMMTESAPTAWQETPRGRNPVEVEWKLYGNQEVGFMLGNHIPGVPVVIDPWLTFFGGSSIDTARAIAVDSDGYVYVAGASYDSWATPIRAHSGALDAYVARFESSGNLDWLTFLGSTEDDRCTGVSVSGSGKIAVAGISIMSWGAPLRPHSGAYDAFIAQLDSEGNLLWNSFLGGDESDYGRDVAIDGSGNIYFVGASYSSWGSPIRPHSGYWDAFAAKLSETGTLIWHSFVGCSASSDRIEGVALDESANVLVVGRSNASWGAPVRAHSGEYDFMVAKLSNEGELLWHTFLGGSGREFGDRIAVDGENDVYVVGAGRSIWGSPVRDYSGESDAYVAKLDGGDGHLVWNTFLGNSGNDYGYGIAVNNSGRLSVVGGSASTWGSPIRAYSGLSDAFVAKLDCGDGNLIWSTFIGTTGSDDGSAIALDGDDNSYIAGRSRSTWGSPLNEHPGGTAGYVIELDSLGNLVVPEMSVEGDGETIENGDATPSLADGTDIGSVDISSGLATSMFIVSNTSDEATIRLTDAPAVSISGSHAADFSVSLQPEVAVDAGASTAFEVAFDPSSTGVKLATVTIGYNDPASSPYTFSIQGRGTTVLTVTGVTAEDKDYDGTTLAGLHTGSATLVGVVEGDDVTLDVSSALGTFADEEVGIDKIVTVTGLALAGEDAANYSLIQPTTTASILFPVELHAGWNMVSLPVEPPDTSVVAVFPGIDAIYTWNSSIKSYSIPTSVNHRNGYWVAVSTGRTIGVKGEPVGDFSRIMSSGWNMIGSVYGGACPFGDPDDSPDGSVEGFAYWWDPISKSYQNRTDICSGKGYWVAATDSCVLTMGPPGP